MTTVSNALRWSIVTLLFFAALINYLDRATLSVALPLISQELNFGPATKGVLLSAFFWSYTPMQLPAGWLADRANLRALYAAFFAVWSVACGLTGLAGSLVALATLRVLLGIGEAIYLPGGSRIVSLLFSRPERGSPTGIIESGTRFGLALGAPLAAALAQALGWRKMFFIVGFSALVWLAPWWLVFPAQIRAERKNAVAPEMRGCDRARRVTLNRNLLGLCLGFFCFGYYWYLLVTWLPDYLVTARHFSLLSAGLYASFPYLAFGISMAAGGWIADRLIRAGWDETRARKGVITVAFLTGLSLIAAARAASADAAIALVALGSVVGLSVPNIHAMLQNCAPPEEVGLWTGIENFVGNIGGILSPLVTGFLISWTGSFSAAFSLAALVLVAGLVSYWFVVGEIKPEP